MGAVVFWDVDTQHDFMRADGKLYVPGAESIIANLKRLTDYAHAKGIRVVASADDHVSGHRELSAAPDFQETFPEHCMRGTPGQAKIPETRLRNPLVLEPEPVDPVALAERVRVHGGDILFHKHWFDVFTNANVDAVLGALRPTDIVLYGVATDVCNRYAMAGLLGRYAEAHLYAVRDAMMAIKPEAGERLLRQWGEAGARIVETREIVEDALLEPHLAG